jgi:hypothetical protein
LDAPLSWWMEQLASLKEGQSSKAILRFMDGPYQLEVIPVSVDKWTIIGVVRGLQVKEVFREECSIEELTEAIVQSSQSLLDSARRLGLWDVDCDKLAALLGAVREKGGKEEKKGAT